MSEERLKAVEEDLKKLLNGGASITMQDPRVSSLYRWLAGVLSIITVALMAWVATSINHLNENMARIVAQNDAIIATQRDHGERIKDLERLHATK